MYPISIHCVLFIYTQGNIQNDLLLLFLLDMDLKVKSSDVITQEHCEDSICKAKSEVGNVTATKSVNTHKHIPIVLCHSTDRYWSMW